MKNILVFATLALALRPTLGAEPSPVTTPAPPAPPAQAAVSTPAVTVTDPAAAPPIVRLPPPATGTSTADPAAAAAGAQLGWSADDVNLRRSPQVTLTPRTNVLGESRGIIPKVAKPERKGLGGFLGGFANLFNPFAPVEKGVAASPAYWYDGDLQAAGLPRGFRDERYHEARTELIAVDLDGTLKKPVAPAR